MAWWGFTSVSAAAMKRNLTQPHPYNALMLQAGGIAEMFCARRTDQPWYPSLPVRGS